MKQILKLAALILKERDLEQRLKEVRAQRFALGRACSSGLGKSPDRHDLTVSIPLGEYLTLFADKNPKPSPQSYESDDRVEVDGQIKTIGHGTKQYFIYPPQFAGTLPTKPPTHVWAESSTDAVWAQGDPKPLANAEAVAA